jgi:hypothetical protein
VRISLGDVSLSGALTRARDHLYISYSGSLSKFLG